MNKALEPRNIRQYLGRFGATGLVVVSSMSCSMDNSLNIPHPSIPTPDSRVAVYTPLPTPTLEPMPLSSERRADLVSQIDSLDVVLDKMLTKRLHNIIVASHLSILGDVDLATFFRNYSKANDRGTDWTLHYSQYVPVLVSIYGEQSGLIRPFVPGKSWLSLDANQLTMPEVADNIEGPNRQLNVDGLTTVAGAIFNVPDNTTWTDQMDQNNVETNPNGTRLIPAKIGAGVTSEGEQVWYHLNTNGKAEATLTTKNYQPYRGR